MTAWLPYRRPLPNPDARIFCFAHAGGAASVFRTWQDQLAANLEVCAIQLPGREARLAEKPIVRMDELARTLAELLRPLLDRPAIFFGYSLGSAIAYETALQIRERHGREPARFYACARRAPQLSSAKEPIYALPEEAFKQRLRELGGTPEEVLRNAELLELVLPVLRADFELNDTYLWKKDRAPLECPVHVWGGVDDAEVQPSGLEAWRETTTGPFALRLFSGGHFFLRTHLSEILREISSRGC